MLHLGWCVWDWECVCFFEARLGGIGESLKGEWMPGADRMDRQIRGGMLIDSWKDVISTLHAFVLVADCDCRGRMYADFYAA